MDDLLYLWLKLICSVIFIFFFVTTVISYNREANEERASTITVMDKKIDKYNDFIVIGTDLDGNEKKFELSEDLVNADYRGDETIKIGNTYKFTIKGRERKIPLFGEREEIIGISSIN